MVYFYKIGGDFNMNTVNIKDYTQIENIYLGIFNENFTNKHTHNFLELVYVIEGSALHTMNGEEFILKKGNYFIVDFNTEHGYTKLNSDVFKIVNCLFLPGFIDKTLNGCQRFSDVMNHYLIHHSYKSININPANRNLYDISGKIGEILEDMQSEYTQKHTGYLELLRCKLIEIIIATMREIQSADRIMYNSIEKFITEYINENYMNKITLKEISAKLNYSVPYLSKMFKEECGITFEQFLQKTRVAQGCRLLANTDKKICDIAECVGYNDTKFFINVFKKNLNMSPREYRKLYR